MTRFGTFISRIERDNEPQCAPIGLFCRVALATVVLLIAAGATSYAQSESQNARSSVRGTIRNAQELPVAFAEVTMESRAPIYADSSGAFTVPELTEGVHTFLVRKLGYGPIAFSLRVPADSIVSIVVRLSAVAEVLDAVVTTAKIDSRLEAVGFLDRQRRLNGRFITREEIDSRPSSHVSDFLEAQPRIRLQPFGARGKIPYGGSGCIMAVTLDGTRINLDARPQFRLTLDDIIQPSMIEAIEIYPSATGAPPQFVDIAKACGAIVIWTRR